MYDHVSACTESLLCTIWGAAVFGVGCSVWRGFGVGHERATPSKSVHTVFVCVSDKGCGKISLLCLIELFKFVQPLQLTFFFTENKGDFFSPLICMARQLLVCMYGESSFNKKVQDLFLATVGPHTNGFLGNTPLCLLIRVGWTTAHFLLLCLMCT